MRLTRGYHSVRQLRWLRWIIVINPDRLSRWLVRTQETFVRSVASLRQSSDYFPRRRFPVT